MWAEAVVVAATVIARASSDASARSLPVLLTRAVYAGLGLRASDNRSRSGSNAAARVEHRVTLARVTATEAREEFLRGISIFAGLAAETVARVAERAEPRELRAGEWLFREGEPGDVLYVLRSGRLEIVQEAGGNEIVIRSVPSGGVLGELALLTGATRSASARARRDCTLLSVSRGAFLELLETDPA